ncbi:MAG: AMP-binding protein [Myxococcales bacterium]|nr:AMP-binding protein [Myxococcales bacterium]TDJ03386.1 MAG: long-chain fatty acid--CoA ligase [Deltaproteobacteria bacterium]
MALGPVATPSDSSVGQDPSRLTFGHFLSDIALRYGEREAIVFEGQRLSYRELESEVRRLARALIGAGVVKGARVAVLMSNRPEWIFALFAVGLVGGVLVPVNTFARPEERDYILRHGDASLLLLQRSLLKHAYLDELVRDHPELAAGEPGALRCEALPQLRRVVCLELEEARGSVQTWDELLALGEGVSDALLDAACAEVHPADDALIIYTSGTTAHPKGVLHAQRAGIIESWRFAEQMRLDPDDRVWTAQPFFWTAGICMSLGATLAAGACLIVQEYFEPGRALELIESERATTVHAWAHQDKALAEHPSASDRDFSSLRKVNFSTQLAKLAGIEKDEWGPGGSYGLSETFTLAASIPSDAPAEIRRSTSGMALPGMQLRVVDPESGEPVPTGQAGEIAVKGVTLMRGYYKVVPEAYLDENGFFRTQDGGWLDEEGYVHWTGRISGMIKTGGANVSPVEIERQLEGYKNLRVGLPVGVPHPTLGEALVVCAVPREGAQVSEAEVKSYLRSKLAPYKVPKRVLFFSASELSYTGNQKIQVGPLREAALRRLEAERAEIDGHTYEKA